VVASAQVKDFESYLDEDHRMEVYGFVGDSKELVQALIGLGPERTDSNFSEVVRDTAAEAL